MKKIIYLITLSVLLFAGCSKHPVSPKVPEQFDRYIFFSQQVQTKAELIESGDAMGQFGVVGFKYDNSTSWENIKSSATPNVFFDDAGNDVNVETCIVDGSNASYSPLQGWSNSKKYSFFAYYPMNNVTLVNLDGSSYTRGVPAIKYEMSGTDLKGSMVDLMVATPHTNLDGSSSGVTNADVDFSFNHCLAALGLNIENASTATIHLTAVTLSLSNIQNSTAIIAFDGSSEAYEGSVSNKVCGITLPYGGLDLETEDSAELSDKLILIPQSEDLSVDLTINYKRTYSNGTVMDGQTFTTSTPLKTALTKGMNHTIYLKFTDSNTYAMVKSGNWETGPNVNHEFN
jgi:hypothetical protein